MEDYRHKIPWGVGWVKEPGQSNRAGLVQKVRGVKNHTQV